MSWSEFFPVFGDEQISEYETLVTTEERAELEHWLGVDRVINSQNGVHLISVSLFWKNLDSDETDLTVTGREQMKAAAKLGLISRWAPWEHYVVPLLEGAVQLRAKRENSVLRIYLAADLGFLVEDLVEVGCEVFLMKSSSIRHNPGALWRFLAMQETGRWVTIIDSDRADQLLTDVDRTEQLRAADLGLWRVPYFLKHDDHIRDPAYYRPIYASQFGAKGGQPVEQLLKAFIWHSRRGTMATVWRDLADLHQARGLPMATTKWPDYGFDEWFLLAAFYPRMAFAGVLTFLNWSNSKLSICHALDIEFVTWASPRSEIFGCPRKSFVKDHDMRAETQRRLVVRPDATVIRRERPKFGPAQSILNYATEPEVLGFSRFQGDLKELLKWSELYVSTLWWMDLNPRIKIGKLGGELFCDRRYAQADVVVCGWRFIVTTPEIAKWAADVALHGSQWNECGILKVPKLDGPVTLWRTDFSKEFFHNWKKFSDFLPAEVFLLAWMQLSRARVLSTTAKQMGWIVR